MNEFIESLSNSLLSLLHSQIHDTDPLAIVACEAPVPCCSRKAHGRHGSVLACARFALATAIDHPRHAASPEPHAGCSILIEFSIVRHHEFNQPFAIMCQDADYTDRRYLCLCLFWMQACCLQDEAGCQE